uniref:Uncharacterized protein n=1 Tax=Anguilla anguilla TaxID=7936 RepID=A0A0E9UMA0_ANGAN
MTLIIKPLLCNKHTNLGYPLEGYSFMLDYV